MRPIVSVCESRVCDKAVARIKVAYRPVTSFMGPTPPLILAIPMIVRILTSSKSLVCNKSYLVEARIARQITVRGCKSVGNSSGCNIRASKRKLGRTHTGSHARLRFAIKLMTIRVIGRIRIAVVRFLDCAVVVP